jgi:predicted nucleic acid-binding protein
VILVDANVLMYATGAPHPHKDASAALIMAIGRRDVAAATDAEVLQEILHRYRALKRWQEGRMVYDDSRRLFPDVIPVTGEITDHARRLLDEVGTLTPRDAIHAAIVLDHRLDAICSYDRDFDRIPGLRRIEP